MPIEKKPVLVTPTGATSKSKAEKLPKPGEVSEQDLDKVSGGIDSQPTGAGAGKVTFNP
jgi:hypothetical protein